MSLLIIIGAAAIAVILLTAGVLTFVTRETSRAYRRQAAHRRTHEPEPDEGTEREGCD